MGTFYGMKHYDDGNDDGYGGGAQSSTTAAPGSYTTPRPANEELVLTILYIFANGDVLIAMEERTSRICAPTPLPSASSTIHKERDPSTSTLDLSLYPAKSSPATTSYNASGWPDSQPVSSTPSPSPSPSSSSSSSSSSSLSSSLTSPMGYGYVTPTTSSASDQDQMPSPAPDQGPPHHHFPIGMAVAIPLVLIGAFIAGFFAWRRKRQQRRTRASMTQEMKMRSTEDGLPQYSADIPPPPAPTVLARTGTGADTASSTLTAPAASLAPSSAGAAAGPDPDQPVILNNNMGGAYFTGIDTSDALSITSGNPSNRMSLDARSMMSSDDPPPPYRPRSVPPISRETSLRVPNQPPAAPSPLEPLSESNLSRVRLDEAPGMSNPFADPESDDDFASEASTPLNSPLVGRRGGNDTHSSDVEYPSLPSRR